MRAVINHGPGEKSGDTAGLVDTYSIPTLLRLISAGKIGPVRLNPRFELDQAMDAYDTFARPGDTGALKVLMRRVA